MTTNELIITALVFSFLVFPLMVMIQIRKRTKELQQNQNEQLGSLEEKNQTTELAINEISMLLKKNCDLADKIEVNNYRIDYLFKLVDRYKEIIKEQEPQPEN